MPTEDPSVAGFVKTGNPRPAMRADTPSGSSSHPGSRTTSYGTTARPDAANSAFCTALSIPIADPRTPAPTYGTPASSNMPWTAPSSPRGPCRTGNTTSMGRRDPSAATSSL